MTEKIKDEADEELRKQLNEIYTPLAEAEKEIWRRWNDKDLRKKVEEYLNGNVPEFLKDKPKLYFARQVITPNFELLHFLKVAGHLDMDFVLPEYSGDKFSTKNGSKYHLGKLYFHNGKGKNGGDKLGTVKVIDFDSAEGKKLNKIKTLWQEDLMDFHHRILFSFVPEIKSKMFDISEWKKCTGAALEEFYPNFLALFLCNGILFENFLINKEEKFFTENIVLPNIKKIEKKFGLKPLIVKLLPPKNEDSACWFHYPGFIEAIIKNQKILSK